MSYYNNYDTSWKEQSQYPPTNSNTNNTSSSNYQNNYDAAHNTLYLSKFTNDDANADNPYFTNDNVVVQAANSHAVTSNVLGFTEEESQVVPDSLDHLSREELCHMIYRLDYERHTLKGQVEALRSIYCPGNDAADSGNVQNFAPNSAEEEQPTHKSSKRARTSHTQPQSSPNITQESALESSAPTPLDIEKVQKRLGKNVINAVKSAIHGGRKIPRSTVTEGKMNEQVKVNIVRCCIGCVPEC